MANRDSRFTLQWVSFLTDEGLEVGDWVNQIHVKWPA